ncbi:hypothetical protein ACFQL1_17525 [Halomicroarcula sp. GCM10025709]|uniref:hypothetical protein n=1 Tax=Haloarcula TaxID=2237 RepID=UPI0024C3A2C7|nr:hypothetical protein [Halomicroarcula sp. YJ-61-S]
MIRRLLPVGYAYMVVQGLLAVFLPRQAIKLNARLLLSGYENPGDLEPKQWYVRSTRIAGVGMLVTGLTGLLAGDLVEAPDEELSDVLGDDEPGGDDHQVAESDESV